MNSIDRSDHNTELWNIFRKDRLPEESKWCVGFTDSFFRVFKIMFYIFLFLVLIGGVIVTRGGLQILASLLGDHDRRFPNVRFFGFQRINWYCHLTSDFLRLLVFLTIAVIV